MQHLIRGSFATLLVSLALSASPASAQVGFWSFDDVPPGVLTPFSQTKAGITATFSTVAGPVDAFSIGSSFFTTLTGNVLLSANGFSSRLGIGFNRVIDSLDVTFALNTQLASNPFIVQSFLGTNLVGSAAAFGTLRASGFVEGGFVTRGTLFDRVVISSLAPELGSSPVVSPAWRRRGRWWSGGTRPVRGEPRRAVTGPRGQSGSLGSPPTAPI